MKRLMAILAFVMGGFATEMAHPLTCSLITVSRVQVKRHKR